MMYEDTKIDGKNALISGGTSGIGRAITEAILNEGGNVFIFSRDDKKLRKTLEELNDLPGRITGMTGDVSSRESAKRIFEEFDRNYGNIDILINNAGLPARSIVEADYDEIDYTIAVNLAGYLYCAKEAINRMRKSEGGHIVNICSMSSQTRDAETDLYVATKSAIDGFSESLRKKINRYGIKISDIEPGSVGTSMITETDAEKAILQEKYKLLKPEDIAEAVVFCLIRPKRCDVIKIQVKPHQQYI